MADQSQVIRTERQGRVAVLRMTHAPANLLDAALRGALADALAQAEADADVGAVVIGSGLSDFSQGYDLRDFDAGWDGPTVADLSARIDAMTTPVVVALSGLVLGPAFELALAARARVAAREASVGLTDLALGLPPGGGATQRLPRALGAALALRILLSARQLPVGQPGLAILFDDVTEGDPMPAAIALAADLAARAPADLPQPLSARWDGFADPAAYQAAIAEKRVEVAKGPHPAARDIVACVEAAMLLPFAAGLAMEQAAFEDALEGANARALRHVAVSERRAAHMPEAKPGTARPITRVGIVGGGVTAAGLVAACLSARLPVIQFERSAEALADARKRVLAVLSPGDQPAADTALAQWTGTSDLIALSKADLIIEAVAEVPATKVRVFAALAKVAAPDAVLATHSATLPIAPMAAAAGDHAARVLGLHCHAPLIGGRLAEVIPAPGTAPDAVAAVAEFARTRLGRVVVRNGAGGGLLEDRILAAARDAGLAMLAEGVPIAVIDRALAEWGLPLGLFRQMDALGLDPLLARGRVLADAPGFASAHLAALDRLVAAGRTGRASGNGFYAYTGEGGTARPDDAVQELLFGAGIDPLALDASEIRLRVLAAMANAGARMLRADLALRPSDIDVALVLGAQFPRWRGGPMKAADLEGLFDVLRVMKRLSAMWPALYAPDPGFAELIKNGENFDALNKIGRNRRKIPG